MTWILEKMKVKSNSIFFCQTILKEKLRQHTTKTERFYSG
jgi:hypothetical protein